MSNRTDHLQRVLTDESIPIEMRALVDAFSVLPATWEFDDHLAVLDRDAIEARATNRDDLVALAGHIRSTIVTGKAFCEAFERMFLQAGTITELDAISMEEIPGPLVGSLIDAAINAYRQMGTGLKEEG